MKGKRRGWGGPGWLRGGEAFARVESAKGFAAPECSLILSASHVPSLGPAAFSHVVFLSSQAFAPELLLVSSGYDAGYLDPLATMMLSSEHFRTLGQKLNGLAEDVCDGRIVYVHEVGAGG